MSKNEPFSVEFPEEDNPPEARAKGHIKGTVRISLPFPVRDGCECIRTWNGVVDIECDACISKEARIK